MTVVCCCALRSHYVFFLYISLFSMLYLSYLHERIVILLHSILFTCCYIVIVLSLSNNIFYLGYCYMVAVSLNP